MLNFASSREGFDRLSPNGTELEVFGSIAGKPPTIALLKLAPFASGFVA